MENNQVTTNNISEGKKRSVIEQLWLNYYNEALYSKGVISEDVRNKMKVQITNRSRKHSMER